MLDTAQDVMATLEKVIREVIAEDWLDELEITAETSFNSDLELESIEFVALAERLESEFGDQVHFVAWLSGKELDEIINLKVGDVAEFITSCR